MRRIGAVAACVIASVSLTRLGVFLGHHFLPRGAGYPGAPTPDLFRFDSYFYLDLARRGYAFNGDVFASPNVVFAPLFPWLVRLGAGFDPVGFGFALNFACFVAAVVLTFRALELGLGFGLAFAVVFAQTTSAGSYAFHAYYSESVAYLTCALILWGAARPNDFFLALGASGLGAARAVGLVPALVIALNFLRRGHGRDISPRRAMALALFSLAGSGAYLGLIAIRFGNPFGLLPAVQSASWGLFHPPTEWLRVITGSYLSEYLFAAATRPPDVRTLNLAWTIFGVLGIPFALRWRFSPLAGVVFAAYASAVYALDASSEYLISAPRLFVLMVPSFLMVARAVFRLPRGPRWVAGTILLLANAVFALGHAACFNQGWWFYF